MRRSAGFSLIEVMCAILVLGVAVVGLTQGIAASLRSGKESEIQSTAALLAAGQIEKLRADGFIEDGEDQGDCGDELPLYQWTQTITASTLDGLHDVTVTIENARTGQSIYELKTQLFEVPPDAGSDSADSSQATANARKRKERER